MPREIMADEPAAARRRVHFHLVGTDGVTPATGEAGGQPQLSADGAAWSSSGIGTLSAIGNGRYYADLSQAAVATAGTWIETRYKSASTAECPGDSVLVVAHDPAEAVAAIQAKTDTLGTGQVTVVSPLDSDGATLRIVAGDDYDSGDGRSIAWSSDSWPSLASASVAFVASGQALAMSVVGTGSESTKTVRLQLSAAQSALLRSGSYAVQATQADGDVITLAAGLLSVAPRPS